MNIKQVSYSLIGSFLLAGAMTSCVNNSYSEKAKAQAAKYMNGDELLRAEFYASHQKTDDRISAKEINYWDSLLTEAKSKEAYIKGQQMVKDSIDRKFFKRERYRQKLDTIISYGIVNNLQEEYANYINAKDLIRLRENAPKKEGLANELPYQTHYWNLITSAAKQKEAYNKGAADARKELLK